MLNTLLSVADKRLGVVNYTKADDGQMYFGAPGAPCVAKLVKVVAARPYTVSIMEVSEPILPAGFEGPAAQQAPAGRRSKGGKGKIRPAASGHEESKAVAAGENPGAIGNAFPGTPDASVSAAAAPGAAP
uniref:Uncharacterized protein n=1 Tax=Arundo donax TaxID=35708 RepID=A0A0A9BAB8_ARUDO